jgi:hypothetical protein
LQNNNFNVEKCTKLMKSYIDWRLKFEGIEINRENIMNEINTGKFFWHGYDKNGLPTIVIKVKRNVASHNIKEKM